MLGSEAYWSNAQVVGAGTRFGECDARVHRWAGRGARGARAATGLGPRQRYAL